MRNGARPSGRTRCIILSWIRRADFEPMKRIHHRMYALGILDATERVEVEAAQAELNREKIDRYYYEIII